ncbi:PAS domain S-box-containing protein [Rhizobiales bacterium GAS188]|nr:PAS domain S-box-containing protein [Rhizobiales bacterium GAS188]
MEQLCRLGAQGDGLQVLWEEGERILCRGWRLSGDGARSAALSVLLAAERPSPAAVDRLAHEYGLRDELEPTWAARPLELTSEDGRPVLLLEDPGGEPLARLIGEPMETGRFLRLAIDICAALDKAHRGLVHKDIKPANILVNCTDGRTRLTGFGIASRQLRERETPGPPEFIAGTLAYMAPEQTGRMNRSIDSRSDLYALGATLYHMLTGRPPFSAADPMELVHCHIARRPAPPAERLESVPTPISNIVMKLLAKPAEERYQSAAGIKRDLGRCLLEWDAQGRIDDFQLGERDTLDRLLIPEKLYGRERDVEALLAAFDRVVESGAPELLLVSGYSGIGKSSVVNELHKALVPPRGLFASGKFDQYKRDIPYSTLAQAFQSLVRPMLGASDAALTEWREALREALEPNGRLIADLVPELTFVIGEQPPVPMLESQQAKGRFQLVFRRFIGVFATANHPLVLFLDDLQWLDLATLDLIENLLTQADVQHLLLIGAYRDNEVDAQHPLTRKLTVIRASRARVSEINLGPLDFEHVEQLTKDALHSAAGDVGPLSHLVHAKTAGNPFFVLQFIHALADEGLLAFDHEPQRWSWNLERIHAKGYADNVADLMVGKVVRLPIETQTALREFACLGNVADIATLAIVLGTSEDEVHAAFWEPVRLGLVERLSGQYRFVHDRVQEAAYSGIPEERRATTHLRIGRLLAAHCSPENREEAIFDIVNHLNRGAALIGSPDERRRVAELNLIAGKRAKASAAYASALNYVIAGLAFLPEDRWVRRHDLIFQLELHRSECEFLTGDLTAAAERLTTLSARAANMVERAAVACLRIDVYTTLDQSGRAIAVILDYLRHLGIDWSPHPTEEEVRREYARIWSQLGSRAIEELIELPVMSDPASLATLDVLTKATAPALFTDRNFFALVICRIVNLSLAEGNSDGSCLAYVWFGMVPCQRFGDYQTGFRFGWLGYELVEQRGLRRFQAQTYLAVGSCLIPWTRHVRVGGELLRRAFEAASKIGDLSWAGYCGSQLNTNLLAAGDPLPEVQREAENGLAFARKMRFALVIDRITTQLALIRTLRGLTPKFGSFDDEAFDELTFEQHLASDPSHAISEGRYWVRKLQARFFAGDYLSAVDASRKAQQLLWKSPPNFEAAEYHFFGALSRAASCDPAFPDQHRQHFEALTAHHRQLEMWAENCPENFESRAALVGAEIARIEGREVDAMRLYDQAIRSTHANGFIHDEALANEVAARFYAARGFEKIAQVYLRDARYGYLRWGADGKVRQLDELYPDLRTEAPLLTPMSTIGAPVDQLDLATVIKVLQSVSGEIVLEKLMDALMRTAIEQAGAERGLLALARGAELWIAAEATTSGDTALVHLRDQPMTADALPESVLRYVMRARESMILDDAVAQSPFKEDPYIRQRRSRSILCLPLINQAELIGVLYLENNLAPRVFAPARIAVLKLLASQAAISLENTRLYADLQRREAKIRRLVESNIIGVFIWDLEGQILEANDAFLRIVGYGREDLVSGRLSWSAVTPTEWVDRDRGRWMPELRVTGSLQPCEKEYFRKDGSRVSVLIGVASFEESDNQGVAFVLDLTERKRMESETRDYERRYREVQMELAHANRVTTMGQLTASIAHEVNQPIAGILTNAQVALRYLGAELPKLEKAQEALGRIVRDSTRAGAVVHRIRNLSKKTSPRDDRVEINAAICEVIELTRSEARKNGVSVQTELADGLPLIRGDRVELQQVVLNLIFNALEAMSGMDEQPRELLIATGKTESGEALVAVRDSGPGLAPAALEHLFKAFYTTKPSGLGLGLSICRSIIEAHAGRLWACANTPRGAVFQFTLPAHPDISSRH